MTKAYHPERGGAALYIILGIALLAGLSYAIAKGFRFSGSSMSNNQATMSAQEIIDYGTAMANGVQKLRLRGCTETQINFESTELGIANNPLAPSGGRCDVFESSGAAMTPRLPTDLPDGLWLFYSGQSSLAGVGTEGCGNADCADLYMAYYMNGENSGAICEQINQTLGHTTLIPVPVTTYMLADSNFTGTYGTHPAVNPIFSGKNSLCFNYSVTPDVYIFLQVLIAR